MNKFRENFIKKIKQDKKLIFIVILGILGMLLLCFSTIGEGNVKSEKSENSDVDAIQQSIEKRLVTLLKSVDGVGDVKVLVTLDCLEEKVIAFNTESESSADSYEYSDEYVLVENSGDTDGLTTKVIMPVVRGVGISCQGASSNVVKQEITKLVCSALGISANKIWVTLMQE
ncbi:MAG: hypothetical protein IKL10_04450 [Clostridia bacterium]|nr:hypothetical protein [Clostridia bacterium]